MAGTVLGISVGPTAVTLVRLRKGIRSVHLDGAVQVTRDSGWTPAELGAAVHKVIEGRNLQADQVVLGLPLSEVFVRVLSFPFSGRSKVAQVLPLELERELPVELDSLCTTFCPAGRDASGFRFLTGALPTAVRDAWVNGFANAGITLDGLDLSLFGAGFLGTGLERGLPETVLLFGMEDGQGEVLLLQQGKVVDMTRMSLPSLRSSVDGPAGAEEQDVHTLARDAARRLRLFLLAGTTASEVRQVLLYGEGSRLEGVDSALELALDIPVQNLGDYPQVSVLQEVQEQGVDPAAYVSPVGLALRGPHGGQSFDFLAEGASGGGGRLSPKRMAVQLTAAALVVACAWGTVSGLRLRDAGQRLAEIEDETRAVFLEVVPEVRGSLRFSQYASVLRDRIRTVSGAGPTVAGPTYRAVDDLLGISRAVGKNREVELDSLTLDDKVVRMTGTADGFGTVEGVKRELAGVPGFQDVSIKGAKAAASGQGVSFSLELVRLEGDDS